MRCEPTPIAGVYVVSTEIRSDSRGQFARLFCDSELSNLVEHRTIRQINFSRTLKRGAIRGLHFQVAPHCETKFVRCIRGKVWDVAVDLRAGSPTFLKHHVEELSAGNAKMMVIPEGCAHGFQALEDDSELLYLHTASYRPEYESGARYDDPRLGIVWPLSVTETSVRDLSHHLIDDNFNGILTGMLDPVNDAESRPFTV